MAALRFLLAKNGDRPAVIVRINLDKNTKVQATVAGLFAFRKLWNPNKQKHNTKNVHPMVLPEVIEIDKTLATLSAAIMARVASVDPANIDRRWLLAEIDAVLHPDKRREPMLLACVDEFISTAGTRIQPNTGKPVSAKTISQYNQTRRHIRAYLSASKTGDIALAKIDRHFYDRFVSYLYGQGLKPNTVGKHVKNIKVVLHSLPAEEQMGCEFISGKCKRIAERVDNVYLNEAELAKLAEAELEEANLRKARDMFLLLAWTGCRYSDLNKLTRDHVAVLDDGNKYFRLSQQKTGSRVTIPILPAAEAVLQRYDWMPPAPISSQKFNPLIREACRRAGIDDVVTITRSEPVTDARGVTRLETVQVTRPKCEFVSAHTARRSFATNMYRRGMPTITIMAITGHKTEQAFMLYIKATEDEHAEQMMRLFLASSPSVGDHHTDHVK